jgi:hypothetical protein
MSTTKQDNRLLCDISDSELEDIFWQKAVSENGHCSVKSFLNDHNLWGVDVETAMSELD